MLYQQGDVLIESVERIPAEAREVKHNNGRLILAAGEATGHAHAITALGAMLLQKDNDLFVTTKEETEVVHEEHGTVVLPAGDFKIRKVVEFDHFMEEAREVAD